MCHTQDKTLLSAFHAIPGAPQQVATRSRTAERRRPWPPRMSQGGRAHSPASRGPVDVLLAGPPPAAVGWDGKGQAGRSTSREGLGGGSRVGKHSQSWGREGRALSSTQLHPTEPQERRAGPASPSGAAGRSVPAQSLAVPTPPQTSCCPKLATPRPQPQLCHPHSSESDPGKQVN